MPNYWPLSSGNWSNLSNWLTANTPPFNAAVLPAATDDVYANNKIIYVDGNYRVASVRNLSATNISAGGSFILNNNRTLSAFVIGGGVNDVACVRFLSGDGTSATIFGSLCAGDINSPVSRPVAVENFSGGTFNVFGNCLGGWKDISTSGDLNSPNNGIIINLGSGNINLVGNYIGDLRGPVGGIDNNYPTIRNHSTGYIFLTGSVIGGAGRGSCGIYNHLDGIISVVGTVSAGNVNQSHGIRNQSSGNVSILGDIYTLGTSNPQINDSDTAGITMFSDGDLVVNGNIFSRGPYVYGINLKGSSNAIVYGNINLPSEGPSTFYSRGILHNSTGILQISGNIIGSGRDKIGILAQNNGNTFIKGNLSVGFPSTSLYLSGGNSSTFIEGNIDGQYRGIFSEFNTTRNIYVTGNVIGGYGPSNIPAIYGESLNLSVFGNIGNGQAKSIDCSGNVSVYGFVGGNGINLNTGTIFLSGNARSIGGFAINNIGGSSITVFGNIGESGIRSNSGNITVNGFVSGHTTVGIYATNCDITVDGSVIGGYAALGILSTNIVRAKKAIGNQYTPIAGYALALSYFPAICANHILVEELECGSGGAFPVTGRVYLTKTNNNSFTYRTSGFSGFGRVTMFTSSSASILPMAKDVRSGTEYDFGNLTGTLAIPNPDFVRTGQITDNTVGKGTFTDGGIVWDTPLSQINIPNSMGERSKNIIAIEEMGEIIKNLS